MNNNALPIAVAASHAPCINPCKWGGDTLDTKDNPRGEMNNSATVKMKYIPTNIQGVTRIDWMASKLIFPKDSFAGKANEIIIIKI